jgi:hypothetical protein
MRWIVYGCFRAGSYGFVILSAVIILGSPTWAEIPSEQSPEFGKLLDQYATVAGGWCLEQRCNVLDADQKKELEWNVGESNKALMKRFSKPDFLLLIQNSAQQTAATYPCDASIVRQILGLSRQLVYTTTGRRYSGQEMAIEADDIRALVFAQKTDDKCKLIPPDIRSDFDKDVSRIEGAFKRANGDTALSAIMTASAQHIQQHPLPCDNRTTMGLQITVAQARKMADDAKP